MLSKSSIIKKYFSIDNPSKRISFTAFPKIYKIHKNLVDLPDFSDIKNMKQHYIKHKKVYRPMKVKQDTAPINDFIDFKKMCGNEILLNLQNLKYFRLTERINCFYELTHRILLPENKNIRNEALQCDEY